MTGAVALSAKGIGVSYGGRRILDNVDLELRAGELTILAGPNGAGKTSAARAMAGLAAAEGEILLNGVSLSTFSPREKAKALSYLPQGHQYHWPMPVRDIVALGRAPHADMFDRHSRDDRKAVEDA